MDYEDIIFGIYLTIVGIATIITLIVGVYTVATQPQTTQETIEITTDYQKCICEKVEEKE